MNKTELLQRVIKKTAQKELDESMSLLSSSQKDCLDDLKINVESVKDTLGKLEVRCDRNSWSAEELERLLKEKSFTDAYFSQQGSTLIFTQS